ncbi:MAG: permease [Planctomycetia bacterium]|nr:permease [Planctomycetia bacterium]
MPQLTPEEAVSLFLIKFLAILWEAMPFIVLGAILAGILEEFLPQQAITKFLPKQMLPAVMIGALLGLIFPMCECGILVVMRRLLRKGLPLACCIAYMLAGPIINVVVIFSTWIAFRDHNIGWEMVGLRVGLAFVVACVTGLVVQSQYRKYGKSLLVDVAAPLSAPMAVPVTPAIPAPAPTRTDPDPLPPQKKAFIDRLGNISATAMHDFVDITLFLIIGAALAAAAKLFITPGQVEALSRDQPYLAIPAMMALAVVMCLCSEADAFVAASFTKMHTSAKLAFLVLGPMLDLKLLLMYTRVFRPRLIIIIVLSVTLQVLIFTLMVHLVYQANGWTGLPSARG